jgi:outer membrane immunogenic protein
MKNHLLAILAALAVSAVPASAADIPVKALPYVANWNGWYAGANVGYSFGRSATDTAIANSTTGVQLFAASNSFGLNGLIAGLQIGANFQRGQWVWGVEGDIQWSGQKGSMTSSCTPGVCNTSTPLPVALQVATFAIDQKLDWFGTLRGRLGFTPKHANLVYLTGGLAWGHIKTDSLVSGFTAGGAATSAAGSDSQTKLGWTIGAGLESQLHGQWTGKIEYLYMDLGSVSGSVVLPTNFPPITASYSSHIIDHIVRVGLNYRFHP